MSKSWKFELVGLSKLRLHLSANCSGKVEGASAYNSNWSSRQDNNLPPRMSQLAISTPTCDGYTTRSCVRELSSKEEKAMKLVPWENGFKVDEE